MGAVVLPTRAVAHRHERRSVRPHTSAGSNQAPQSDGEGEKALGDRRNLRDSASPRRLDVVTSADAAERADGDRGRHLHDGLAKIAIRLQLVVKVINVLSAAVPDSILLISGHVEHFWERETKLGRGEPLRPTVAEKSCIMSKRNQRDPLSHKGGDSVYVLPRRLMPLARRESDKLVILELPVKSSSKVPKLDLEGLAKVGPVAVGLNSKLGVELQRGVAEVRRDLPYLPRDFEDEGAIEQRKARARGPTSLGREGTPKHSPLTAADLTSGVTCVRGWTGMPRPKIVRNKTARGSSEDQKGIRLALSSLCSMRAAVYSRSSTALTAGVWRGLHAAVCQGGGRRL